MTSKTHKDIFYKRTAVVTVFFLVFFLIIIGRLADLQIVHGDQSRQLADQQHSIYEKLLPSRGEIKITDKFSNDAYPVAANVAHILVYAVPSEIKNPDLTAGALAGVLTMAPQDVLPKLTDPSRKYVPIKKDLTDDEQQKVKDLKLPGIYFDSEDGRIYPQNQLLSSVLGFVGYNAAGDQKVGLYGLEKYFQDELAGKNGYVDEEKDAAGAWIFGGRRDIVPAQDGDDLILTIDKTIQYEAESVLQKTVTEHGADSGSIIVVNPKTGAVLAMAGFPDFDPNQYNKVQDPNVFLNQATQGNYEPGSTFKAITMAAALNENKITPQTTYTDTGSVSVDNYVIKNAEAGGHGVQTMTQALDFSYNTGAIYAENQLGNPDFLKYVQAFGFGQKTGVELPEGNGDLSNLKGNIQVNYDTSSFGQGITVTPIQLVEAYTALANGGKMMQPYIVQSKITSDGAVINTNPHVVSQVVTAKTASTISGMLVDVIENGFGKRAAVPGYYLAGKTGTAQVAGKNGKYDPTNNIGSFIGYGPIEDPKFLMLVRIDHPRDVQFAESTAGPAFGEIAKFILDYYNIAPTRPLPGK